MDKKLDSVRVRIAPSPTGEPHVGTAYVALFNWAFARKSGGKFILRIEDTDRSRSRPEYEAEILRSLRWLGLDWDEGPDIGGDCGPYRQSERLELYREHMERLLKAGEAYYCFCTPERLERMREERKGESFRGYDGHCRGLSEGQVRENLERNLPYVVRLRVPREGETAFEDMLRGRVCWRNEEIDDQVLLKSDGFPTYHLASVVDDHSMGITHVIRAEEWISSTPKHILLYRAFGWPVPKFCHLSLLRNRDRSKISKRRNPCSLHYYRKVGIFPQALLNFLGLQGYSMPQEQEIFSLEEFARDFDVSRIKTRSPVFDLEKLFHINGVYLRSMSRERLVEALLSYTRGWLEGALGLAQERMESLGDFFPLMAFLWQRELVGDFGAILPKRVSLEEARGVLGKALEAYGSCEWSVEGLRRVHGELAKALGLKKGKVFMTLRTALLGKLGTPPLEESLVLMDRFQVIQRLEGALGCLEKWDV